MMRQERDGTEQMLADLCKQKCCYDTVIVE